MSPSRKRRDEPIEMGGVLLQPGSRIGSYVFLREIGSGGMARVLLAKDPAGDLVALKVLRKSRFKTGLVRFRREFRSLSRINHPNVIRVEAYGDLFGHPYIAMEYVDGPDLHSQIRAFRGWEPERRWRRVEEILLDLARALSAIHRRGWVHRDLKPSNVLISRDGVCKLTDFGIVKDLDPSRDPHLSTTLVGTWAYASPEQITGAALDYRSDLYSLGVILFAMLTGKRPFVANDMAGYLALHRDRPAPAPRDVNPHIPELFDEITRRLLQKSPRDRYQSAQEILYRLEATDHTRPPPSVSDGWEPPLVGRDLELEALANTVSRLTRGEGGLCVLQGDDGSGKSRLMQAAAHHAESLGFPVHALTFERNNPVFTAILALGQQLEANLGDAAPDELALALALFSRGEAPQGDTRYALFDGLRESLSRALDAGPRVIILDDLHLAHPREIDLLGYLLRSLVSRSQLPLLMVAGLRPKANPSADALAAGADYGVEPVEIFVGTLSREDLADVLFDMVGDSLGSRLLAERLHRETEGNAYFVTEFLRSLQSQGVIRHTRDGYELTLDPDVIATGHLEIPLGVRQMMRARLEGLRAEDRHTLEVLSVSGREVDLDVLLDVLDKDEEDVLDSLDRLLAAGIIRERRVGETILHAVTHRKFADVVYRDLDPEVRPRLHRSIAAALELHYAQNPAALEVVGEHYRRAGDAGRAYRYLVAAAKRLADRSLMQEAWDLTEKASAIEEPARNDLTAEDYASYRRDNLMVRASVHYNRAEWAEAEKTYRAVLRVAEDLPNARAATDARLELAVVLRRRGRHDESRQCSETALEESRALHYRKGVTEALHAMAALAWAEGRLEECERMANEGLLVAQGSQLAGKRAELLLALTAAQATRGHLASATSGLTEAEGIFRELRQKRPRCLALANIAELLTWQGEPLQARQRAHVAVQLASELDYKLGLTAAQRAMSVAALDLGLYEEARKGLSRALELALEIELPEEVLASLAALTQLAVEVGDRSQANQHAVKGLEMAQHRDPERYQPLLQAHLARALARTSPTDATILVQAAEQQVEQLPVPRRSQVLLALAWAWLALGDTHMALARSRTVMQTAGSRGFRLQSLESRALLTHLTAGEEQVLHRTVGQDLARNFSMGLSPDMARSFARRPFLRYLDE